MHQTLQNCEVCTDLDLCPQNILLCICCENRLVCTLTASQRKDQLMDNSFHSQKYFELHNHLQNKAVRFLSILLIT